MFEERLEEADRLREEGNKFHKDGDNTEAMRRYYVAIHMLDFDMKQWGEGAKKYQDDLDARKLKVISNICLVHLKSKDYIQTKSAADIGILHLQTAGITDKTAEGKFHYLRGLANLERGFSEDAVESLKKAQTLVPSDTQV